MDTIQDDIDTAFADVEADFPEAECGWEVDIARTTVRTLVQEGTVPEEVGREWMRQNGWRY